MNRKTKKLLFVTSIMIFSLTAFTLTILSVILLSQIGDMLSMKLGICGINGITIKIGKPEYLLYVYIFYTFLTGIFLWGIVKIYDLILEYFFGSLFQSSDTKSI